MKKSISELISKEPEDVKEIVYEFSKLNKEQRKAILAYVYTLKNKRKEVV